MPTTATNPTGSTTDILITKVVMGVQSFYVIDLNGQKRTYGTGGVMHPGETLVVTSKNPWESGPVLSGKLNGVWKEQFIVNMNGAYTRYITPTVTNNVSESYQIVT